MDQFLPLFEEGYAYHQVACCRNTIICLKNQVKCGRVAMKKLWGHYDGKYEGERKKKGKGGTQEITLSPLTYLTF